MTRQRKILVVLGTAIVTLLAIGISDFTNAQGGRPWRPNMYNRYKNTQRTYSQPYNDNYGYTVEQAQPRQSFSVEPIDIQAGDTVKVTVDTPLRRGDDVLATVPAGETVKVIKVVGPWVGIGINEDGQQVRGWVTHRAVE